MIVKVNVEVPPARIGFGANNLEILGGRTAVSEAVAKPVEPVFDPLSVAETNPLTLVCGPEVVAVTVTDMLQEPLAASVPPENEIVLGAVVVRVPLHCDEDPVVTVSPDGNVSVNATPVKDAPAFGLVTVNVNVDVAPTATGSGEKLFVIVGGFGMAQPVILMLSRFIAEEVVFAPIALILKLVVLVPVVAAAND